MDFTIKTYKLLLNALIDTNYFFLTFEDYLESKPSGKIIVLRHDVDKMPANSLQMAKMENELAIVGTYYFRIGHSSFDSTIIRQIASLGHEIGYHYETMDICKGKIDEAYLEFCKNLELFRRIVPVETVCMHGSPMSRFDNRDIWKNYDYRNLGIIGEPYFDINFSKVLYLTDTGRRWNGGKVSIRDKEQKSETPLLSESYNFHSTFDVIQAINENKIPNQVMINFHPQRWTNNPLQWTEEFVLQNVKNLAKRFIVVGQGGSKG